MHSCMHIFEYQSFVVCIMHDEPAEAAQRPTPQATTVTTLAEAKASRTQTTRTDLVAALAGLDVHDLAHFV